MSEAETIKILGFVKKQRPNFFKKLSKEEHFGLVEEWSYAMTDLTYEEVFEAVKIFLNQSNSTPYPRQILTTLEKHYEEIQYKTNPWYKHFPMMGNFSYSDEDVKWASYEDWGMLPSEMKSRMHYKPDENDEERNALLVEVEAKLNAVKGES